MHFAALSCLLYPYRQHGISTGFNFNLVNVDVMPPMTDNLNNPVAVIFTIIILKFNIDQLKDGSKCKEKNKKNNLRVIHNFTM